MSRRSTKRPNRKERGTALLIALFALLLIGVVAIALIVASGTESALTGNYRSATAAYYDAIAGLEEGRGRLLSKSPDYFNNIQSGFLPAGPFAANDVRYILNPGPGETNSDVDPRNPTYPDTEYQSEFGVPVGGQNVKVISSVSGSAGIPGPLYKWVRINPATESSLGIDVDSDGDRDSITLYYDPAHVDASGNSKPGLISTSSPPATAVQALEITALAALTNGSRRLLQYVVAPNTLNFMPAFSLTNFPAALVMDGDNAQPSQPLQFTPPNNGSFYADGSDHAAPEIACSAGSNQASGVGYTNNLDQSDQAIKSQITPGFVNHYVGAGSTTPNVNYISLAANAATVGGLNSMVQTITANADVVINHNADATDPLWPAATMSPSNPMTIVVNGDFTTNAWHGTGYGLLLVTGQFTYDPDTYWRGLILVIGKGIFNSHQNGVGDIRGGVLIARLFDSGNNPLPANGAPQGPSFYWSAGGNGIYYSSCWVKAAQPSLSYKVLSFREIAQ